MMLVPCPWCGPRNAAEFRYVGETATRPDPQAVGMADWREYLYFRDNPRGWITERWYHRAGCRQYVMVDRDTGTNATRSRQEA